VVTLLGKLKKPFGLLRRTWGSSLVHTYPPVRGPRHSCGPAHDNRAALGFDTMTGPDCGTPGGESTCLSRYTPAAAARVGPDECLPGIWGSLVKGLANMVVVVVALPVVAGATVRVVDVSPDGGSIAFMSDRDGDFEIFVMNADGTGVFSTGQNGVPHDWGGPAD